MIECPTCKEKIAKNAKVCPKCGSKMKKPFYKRVWFWVVIVIIFIVAISGNDTENQSTLQQNNENQTVENTKAQNEEKVITYTTVEISTLEDEKENNAAAAKEKYDNQYIEFTGYLSTIDSDLKYISVAGSTDSWDFFTIKCRIKNDSQREIIKTLSKDQSVTIKGKVTDVGEVLGYYVDIVEISGN